MLVLTAMLRLRARVKMRILLPSIFKLSVKFTWAESLGELILSSPPEALVTSILHASRMVERPPDILPAAIGKG